MYKILYITFVALALGLLVMFAFAKQTTSYLRGEYGEKCYVKGSEHKNITYPIYYDSWEDCLASLQ